MAQDSSNPTYTVTAEAAAGAYIQDYSPRPKIDGVKIIPLKASVGDEGDFSELLRLNEQGGMEAAPEFQIRQVNRSRVFAKAIKAWHFHYHQDELWYVSPHAQLFVGLWDLRQGSPTENTVMRLSLGGGHSQLLMIPRGVAHGMANFSTAAVDLYYFMNAQFNLDSPDERRLPWDYRGADFWLPERD